MKDVALKEIVAALKNAKLINAAKVTVDQIVIDSRADCTQALFVALSGEHSDGHQYVEAAVANGAVAVLVERELAVAVPQLIVPDCVKALGEIANWWRNKCAPTTFAITGSCGKTTAKELLKAILSLAGSCHATQGNFNNHLGVPLTIFKLKPEHEYLLVEMGASAVGEIEYLVTIAEPEYCAITIIAPVHVEGFGSVPDIARGKAEIYSSQQLKQALYPADSAYAAVLAQAAGAKAKSFSTKTSADIYATEIQVGSDATKFVLHMGGSSYPVTLQLPAEHNVNNALVAAGLAFYAGIAPQTIVAGLSSVKSYDNRLQYKEGPNSCCIIDDSYSANPVAMNSAIELLSDRSGTKILVIGDMLELGADAEKYHQAVGAKASALGIDHLFAVGELSKAAVTEFGTNAQHFADRQQLTAALNPLLTANTTVLVKGSNRTGMVEVVQALSKESS